MNLFEKYEQLKKTGKLLSIGSIWEDAYGTVVITRVDTYDVYYDSLTFNDGAELLDIGFMSKKRFQKLFSKVK
jgi:hypothetical protein